MAKKPAPKKPGTKKSEPKKTEPAKVPVAIQWSLEQGHDSGAHKSRSVEAITDKAAWEALWAQHASRRHPAENPPVVNFKKYMVVAAFMGQKSSAGYAIEIQRLYDDGTNLIVEVKESRPSGGGMSAAVMTDPFNLVVATKNTKPLKVEWK